MIEQKKEEKPVEEGRYGFGTGPAIEAMFKRLGEHKIPTTGLVLINIDTLVRNACNPELKSEEIVNKVKTFMSNIATDYAGVVSQWTGYKHTIIFYHADAMRAVPEIFRRHHASASALQAQTVLANLLRQLNNTPDQVHDNVTSMVRLASSIRQPSYKGLADLCNRVAQKSVTVHMLSHQCIDWHIFRTGRIGILYRSHTGEAVPMTAAKLGEIVFDVPGVPFYPLIHVLLGDKNFIKGVLVRKDKEQFLKLAKIERFGLRSELYINSTSKINKQLVPYKLD